MPDETPDGELNPHLPISIREAARLAGVPREYLEECVASGKLGVHLHQKGDTTKFRVTRSALIASGILPNDPEPPAVDPNENLVALLTKQSERLAAIEEQRFQLAGQLGAALERTRELEERVLALAAGSVRDDSVEPSVRQTSGQMGDSAVTPTGVQPEPPSAEPSPQAPFKLAVRIIRLKPAGRWSVRKLSAIPRIGSLMNGKRGSGK